MEHWVTKLTNNEHINLWDLSVKELYQLHFEEESCVASEMKKLPPFSTERNILLSSGYKIVHEILDVRHIKEYKKPRSSYGVDKHSVNILIKLIKMKMKQNGHQKTILYEAGIGSGFAAERVLTYFKDNAKYKDSLLEIKGCDVDISQNVANLISQYSNLDVQHGHIYDHIREQPNNSIDVFYADNVFEHLFSDESEMIFKEIEKKLKPTAYVFLYIPNSHVGPCDISKHFLPMGEKAKGFHFMEMTFNETTTYMGNCGIYHEYCAVITPHANSRQIITQDFSFSARRRIES